MAADKYEAMSFYDLLQEHRAKFGDVPDTYHLSPEKASEVLRKALRKGKEAPAAEPAEGVVY